MDLKQIVHKLSRKILANIEIENVEKDEIQYRLVTHDKIEKLISNNARIVVSYKGDNHENCINILRGIYASMGISEDGAPLDKMVGEYVCAYLE